MEGLVFFVLLKIAKTLTFAQKLVLKQKNILV
jgi:hypothetical protein